MGDARTAVRFETGAAPAVSDADVYRIWAVDEYGARRIVATLHDRDDAEVVCAAMNDRRRGVCRCLRCSRDLSAREAWSAMMAGMCGCCRRDRIAAIRRSHLDLAEEGLLSDVE